jgi:hypothetical protein
MGPAGLETSNNCAGEGRQKFTSPFIYPENQITLPHFPVLSAENCM